MAHPIGDEAKGKTTPADGEAVVDTSRERAEAAVVERREDGPDPVVGAGITLLGIFLMGVSGASDADYLFDFGVAVAMIGAATFVLFVALSAMKQGRAPSAEPES